MIHCQNCTTRNPLSRDFCWKCGSRLLITSGPAPLDSSMAFMEEHILERLSSLENSIGAVNKRLDSLMETVERVAASNFIDHTMIETLTDTLESAGIDLTNLETEWRKRVDSRILESEEVDRLSARMQRVMDAYGGPDRKQFGLWIEKSYDLIIADRASESEHFLKSAYQHDPSNYELGELLAEVYFQCRDYVSARECLKQVLARKSDHFEATFLMGLIQRKRGNLQEARAKLERAVGLKKDSSAAHASLGALLAEAGNSRQAIKHFSTALKLKPSAPVHFLMSAVCYSAGQHKRAVQHLKQATKLDPHFGEAYYQLGLLCLEMNWRQKAQECFKTAQSINPRETRYRKRVRTFSGGATGPDQLSGLIREELRLIRCAVQKRTK